MHVHARLDARIAQFDQAVSTLAFDVLMKFPIVNGRDPAELLRLSQRAYDLTPLLALQERKGAAAKGGVSKKETKALAAIEQQLQERLQEAWIAGGQLAVDEALDAFMAAEGELTKAELEAVVEAVGQRMGPSFAASVGSDVVEAATDAYDLGRVSLVEKPTFNLVDAKARAWLAKDQMYWIGDHYGAEVGPRIAATVDTAIVQQGLGRAEAGKVLKDLFGAEFGPRSDAYWRGTAACGASRSRNFGAIESMVEAGFEDIVPVNPRDEATSEICLYLTSGSIVFKVAHAVSQRDAMLAAKTPVHAQTASPWLPFSEISGKTAEQLQAMHVVMAPYHFHCRTIMVVS